MARPAHRLGKGRAGCLHHEGGGVELDRQAGERPDYRHQITAARAARIRRELGKDLGSDAAAQAAEPALHGADLDAEIDRFAGQFPEPEPLPPTQAPGAEPGVDPARWNPHDAGHSSKPGPEAATTARTRTTHRHAQHCTGGVPEAPDHLYGAPERNQLDPETDHFGRAAAGPEDAGQFPLRCDAAAHRRAPDGGGLMLPAATPRPRDDKTSIVPVLDAMLADGKAARPQDRLPRGSQNRTRNGRSRTIKADSRR